MYVIVGLGLVDTIEDIQEMLRAVDEDGSRNIEFLELLNIVKNKSGSESFSKHSLIENSQRKTK